MKRIPAAAAAKTHGYSAKHYIRLVRAGLIAGARVYQPHPRAWIQIELANHAVGDNEKLPMKH